MATIGERVLLKFCRSPDAPSCIAAAPEKHNIDNGLDELFTAFPALERELCGKTVLDYGCGPGWQTVCMARGQARRVVGLDVNPAWIEHARQLAVRFGLQSKVEVLAGWDERLAGQFDVVVSKDSFEHYRDPELAMAQMKRALRPGGRLYLVFSWPWYSPLGSHMQSFTLLPWVNLLFSERTVMLVRARYSNDGALRYEDVQSGLNRMTVARFESIVRASGLVVEQEFLRGFKKWQFPTRVPLLRELFTEQVGCVLSRPG
jgi:SAM-dependent methyltransferase